MGPQLYVVMASRVVESESFTASIRDIKSHPDCGITSSSHWATLQMHVRW
jgi:hypothetical protein